MTVEPQSVPSKIATFYRRWHVLEETFGADNAGIIDFDYCPAELVSDATPFANRLEALRAAETLLENITNSNEPLCNSELLSMKLAGSCTYLRALMGEKIPLPKYIRDTLGIEAEPVSKDELDELKEQAQSALSPFGIRWQKEDLEKYRQIRAYPDISRFGSELRALASSWSTFVRAELGLRAEPNYTIEEVQVDEYWTNFVDGKLGQPLRLRFNTHPRKRYHKGVAYRMAAHEVAAHLIQILELSHGREQGLVDAPALNTTLHTCELFQMEGLAQTLMHLLRPDIDGAEDGFCEDAVATFHIATLQEAHLRIEEGRPVDEVLDWIFRSAPFLGEAGVTAELRDRSRSVTFRVLIFAYHPSRKKFMEALQLPLLQRKTFLRSMYRQLWTPQQIEVQLQSLLESAHSEP